MQTWHYSVLQEYGQGPSKKVGVDPGPSKANKRPCKYVIKGEENCIFSHNCGPSEQGVKKE